MKKKQNNSFYPYGRNIDVCKISYNDVKLLTGNPLPLKILIPIKIEEEKED